MVSVVVNNRLCTDRDIPMQICSGVVVVNYKYTESMMSTPRGYVVLRLGLIPPVAIIDVTSEHWPNHNEAIYESRLYSLVLQKDGDGGTLTLVA